MGNEKIKLPCGTGFSPLKQKGGELNNKNTKSRQGGKRELRTQI